MINVVAGPKGSGKTKEMIDGANASLDVCKGNVIFVTDTSDYSRDVRAAIRFINVRDYGNLSEESLVGFIKGIVASDSDVSRIYVDGLARILGTPAEDMEGLFIALDDLSENHGVDFFLSVTCGKAPKFMKKYQ